MNRRNAIVALVSIPFGAFAFKDAAANPALPAFLRVPLDQWSGLVVQHKGRSITLSSAEIFRALCDSE